MSSALGRVASTLHLIDCPHTRVGRSLQLGVGVACTVIGAEALLAPLRFARGVLLPHAELAVAMPVWGLVFIGLGACLTAISVLEVRRLGVLPVSLATAVLLCAVATLRLTSPAPVDAALYA